MSDQTHYEGCWSDPRHHACALDEIERLRAKLAVAHAETNEWIALYNECETPDERDAEIERLRAVEKHHDILQAMANEKDAEIEQLRADVSKWKARAQILREWMLGRELNDFGAPPVWWAFVDERPEAADWFDAEGVPK